MQNNSVVVDHLLTAINDNPADYDLDMIATDLNEAGIDLDQFDPQTDDGIYYQTHEQRVWDILANNQR